MGESVITFIKKKEKVVVLAYVIFPFACVLFYSYIYAFGLLPCLVVVVKF